MGVDVSIPDEYDIDLDFVSALTLAGIPDTFHIDIQHIPKISVGVDPLTIDIARIPKISVGLDPIEVKPLDVSVRLREIPSIRGHLPANFTVGISVLGLQLFAIKLCGEAQMITEPYEPNPCEKCD